MNRSKYVVSIVLVTIFFTSCSWYHIVSENSATVSLKNYKSIFVGWMDLEVYEGNWKNLGYEHEKDWTDYLKSVNEASLPEYFKQWFPEKKIIMARSENDAPSKDAQLYIKFLKSTYYQKTSTASKVAQHVVRGWTDDNDVLNLTMSFIDVNTGKELYNVNVGIESSSGSGYTDMSFEGRINNSLYNTACFVYQKLRR